MVHLIKFLSEYGQTNFLVGRTSLLNFFVISTQTIQLAKKLVCPHPNKDSVGPNIFLFQDTGYLT